MNGKGISIREPRGTSTVEFLVVLPFLLMMMLGIVEFSRAWMTLNPVATAAREGARVGVVRPLSGGAFDNSFAIERISDVLNAAHLTPSVPPTVTCTLPTPPPPDAARLPCGTNWEATATVTVNFSTLFPVFVPGLAGPIALTNTAVIRYE